MVEPNTEKEIDSRIDTMKIFFLLNLKVWRNWLQMNVWSFYTVEVINIA